MVDLQVKNNGLLTTENGGGVREQRINDSEITRINLNPMHDCIFVHVEQWTPPCCIEQNPTSRRLWLLLHNRHCLRIRRDDDPIPRHPLPVLTPTPITCPDTNLNSKFNSTKTTHHTTIEFPHTPFAHFINTTIGILVLPQYFSNTSMRNQITDETNITYHKKGTFLSPFIGRDNKIYKTIFVC